MIRFPPLGRPLLKRIRRIVKTLRGRPPELLEAHLLAARAFREFGDHARAVSALEAAYRVAPRRFDLLDEYADSLERLGRVSDAKKALDYHRSMRPSDDPFAGSASRVARQADEFRDGRDYRRAAEQYARAMEMDKTRIDLIPNLAHALRDDGRFEEAIAVYQRGIALFPQDGDLYVHLAHALKLAGRRVDAVEVYREAGRKDPSLALSLVELVRLGEEVEQLENFDVQLREETVERFSRLVVDVSVIRKRVTEIAASLPQISDLTGIPIDRYGVYRELFRTDVGFGSDRSSAAASWLIMVPAAGLRQDTLFEQLRCFRQQEPSDLRVFYIGRDPTLKSIVERASLSDVRIAWYEAAPTVDAELTAASETAADHILLLATDSVLHEGALATYAVVFAETDAQALVSDDETAVRTTGTLRFSCPRLRATVDYDSLLVANTLGGTVAVRRDAYLAMSDRLCTVDRTAARSSLLLELARDGLIGHVPAPLVWRREDAEESFRADARGHEAAVERHVARYELAFMLRPRPENTLSLGRGLWRPRSEQEKIAVAIPTRDNGGDVVRMVESLRRHATDPDRLDILVLDNGSVDARTAEHLAGLADKSLARIVRADEPFNWSRLSNRAAELHDAPYLVFANDDMEMLSPGWDALLTGLLDRPEIGVVGARLLYADDTLQHGGVLLGWNGAGIHDGLYQPATDPGPLARWHLPRSAAAVTGAFMGTRRAVFDAVGGFDAVDLPIAWSDLDFCLKVRAKALRVHWNPAITLFHYESKTRGLDDAHPDRNARPAAERAIMEARWGESLTIDPSLNPHWHMATLPFRMIRAPSQERMRGHVRRCGSSNPWLIPAPNRVSH